MSPPWPNLRNPTASAYWSAARAYCEALSKQGCLTEVLDVAQACTMDARVEACVQQVLWTHSTQVSSPCEDAWNEDIACGAASSFVAPICEGVHLIGYPYGSASTCSRENDALVACLDKNSAMVTVNGTYASCTYAADSDSWCSITLPVRHKLRRSDLLRRKRSAQAMRLCNQRACVGRGESILRLSSTIVPRPLDRPPTVFHEPNRLLYQVCRFW